jgi:membrane protease subunit (stomatin/prohibitin family)
MDRQMMAHMGIEGMALAGTFYIFNNKLTELNGSFQKILNAMGQRIVNLESKVTQLSQENQVLMQNLNQLAGMQRTQNDRIAEHYQHIQMYEQSAASAAQQSAAQHVEPNQYIPQSMQQSTTIQPSETVQQSSPVDFHMEGNKNPHLPMSVTNLQQARNNSSQPSLSNMVSEARPLNEAILNGRARPLDEATTLNGGVQMQSPIQLRSIRVKQQQQQLLHSYTKKTNLCHVIDKRCCIY